MARVWLVAGGVLAIVSLLFSWWFSYYSSSSFHSLEPMITLLGNSSRLIGNISPIELAGSPGVQINQTDFGINYYRYSFLLPISIMLVILGGLAAIVIGLSKIRSKLYETCSGVMVLGGVALFIVLLLQTAGIRLLAGTMSIFGIRAIWGLGPGVFIALVSAFLIISDQMLRKR